MEHFLIPEIRLLYNIYILYSHQVICTLLMQEYGNMSYKRTEIDVEKQLLVTLTYLGTVQSYKYILLSLSIIINKIYFVRFTLCI